MVVAQLVERLLQTPEISSLNLVIGKFYLLHSVFKNENKEPETGKGLNNLKNNIKELQEYELRLSY